MNSPVNSPNPPDLRTLLDGHAREIFDAFNCHLLGTVADITLETGFVPKVSVQIASKRLLPNGTVVDYPLLTECPLFVLSGGKAYIQMPIKIGDPCLVLFHDTDIDNWWTTGDVGVPNSPRSHSLSDGLVLVGFHNKATPFSSSDPSSVLIVNEDVSITLSETFGITLLAKNNNFISVAPSGDIKLRNAVSGTTIEITAAGKISLVNGSTNLKTAIDALHAVLSAWINTGGSTPNPATLTAITTSQATFDSLLA